MLRPVAEATLEITGPRGSTPEVTPDRPMVLTERRDNGVGAAPMRAAIMGAAMEQAGLIVATNLEETAQMAMFLLPTHSRRLPRRPISRAALVPWEPPLLLVGAVRLITPATPSA